MFVPGPGSQFWLVHSGLDGHNEFITINGFGTGSGINDFVFRVGTSAARRARRG
jgi:hypothetical protein